MNFVGSQFPITGDPFLLHLQYPCMGELADLGPTSLLLTLWAITMQIQFNNSNTTAQIKAQTRIETISDSAACYVICH